MLSCFPTYRVLFFYGCCRPIDIDSSSFLPSVMNSLERAQNARSDMLNDGPVDSGPSSTSGSVTLPVHQKPRSKISKSRCDRLLSSIRPFRGIILDISSRAPFYSSDWSDALNYRVVPATLLIFFAKCSAISIHFTML